MYITLVLNSSKSYLRHFIININHLTFPVLHTHTHTHTHMCVHPTGPHFCIFSLWVFLIWKSQVQVYMEHIDNWIIENSLFVFQKFGVSWLYFKEKMKAYSHGHILDDTVTLSQFLEFISTGWMHWTFCQAYYFVCQMLVILNFNSQVFRSTPLYQFCLLIHHYKNYLLKINPTQKNFLFGLNVKKKKKMVHCSYMWLYIIQRLFPSLSHTC